MQRQSGSLAFVVSYHTVTWWLIEEDAQLSLRPSFTPWDHAQYLENSSVGLYHPLYIDVFHE